MVVQLQTHEFHHSWQLSMNRKKCVVYLSLAMVNLDFYFKVWKVTS